MTPFVARWGGGIGAACAGALLVFSAPGASQTASQPVTASRPLFATQAPVVLLKDMDSGAVLFSRKSDQLFAPASMAKVMTAYVVLDLIDSGKLSRNAMFTVQPETYDRWNGSNGGSTMFLRAGEKVSVDDLLKGLITVSGNDAAAVLAVGIDGSEPAFVARMNRVAKTIGMASSHFGTPNGWPDGGVTRVTADDLVHLADRLIRDFPNGYRRYFSIPSLQHGVTPDGKPITQPNRDPIIGHFPGADGLKTGHTDEAGYCFLGSATRDGRRLIMVVAGMTSAKARKDESMKLMNWGYDQWRGQPLLNAKTNVGRIDVSGGDVPTVTVRTGNRVTMTLPQHHDGQFRASIRYRGPLQAPIKAGEVVADLVVTPDGLPPQTTPLVAVSAVSKGGWLDRARNGLYRLTGL
jgi:serine-type D-Ala-D-Ala carboxypeptidase (penicillin-binding protein 5/6)